ncbi:hypothetical protein HDV63DRAFT_364866 [Trichoderma sp. SZMC 28014]
MKAYILLSVAALCGSATAFWGQLAAGAIQGSEGGDYQYIYLTDYDTGSQYETLLHDGFSGCVSSPCSVGFGETSPGGYNFNALLWRSSDGCHHIDFQGALDSHSGSCCGSLPCDIGA